MVQSHPTTDTTTTTSDVGTSWLANKYAKCIDEAIEAASVELRSLSLKVSARSPPSPLHLSPLTYIAELDLRHPTAKTKSYQIVQ